MNAQKEFHRTTAGDLEKHLQCLRWSNRRGLINHSSTFSRHLQRTNHTQPII